MKKVGLIVGALLVVSGSFVAGAYVGVHQMILTDAQYKAAVIVGDLRMIENEDIPTLRNALETRLDTEIVLHGMYLESMFKWLWPQAIGDTRPITFAVDYRLSHPYDRDVRDSLPPGARNDPCVTAIAEGVEEMRRKVQEVVEMYSDGDV